MERHPFVFEQIPLSVPSGSGTAPTVHHAVAGDTASGRSAPQGSPDEPRMTGTPHHAGYRPVSETLPGGICRTMEKTSSYNSSGPSAALLPVCSMRMYRYVVGCLAAGQHIVSPPSSRRSAAVGVQPLPLTAGPVRSSPFPAVVRIRVGERATFSSVSGWETVRSCVYGPLLRQPHRRRCSSHTFPHTVQSSLPW